MAKDILPQTTTISTTRSDEAPNDLHMKELPRRITTDTKFSRSDSENPDRVDTIPLENRYTLAGPDSTPPDEEGEETVDRTANDVPDGGYGWVVVVCLMAINASIWGEYSVHLTLTLLLFLTILALIPKYVPHCVRVDHEDMLTSGMNTTYGVFSSYYLQHNYFEGGSTFRYAWVGGLSVAVALACGPLANWFNRLWGMKPCLIIG